MARSTFFALEDDAVANDGELVPEAQAEVEAGAAEADTRANEVQDLVDATEDAVGDIDTLTDIQEVARDSVDSGEGLDEPTARVIETAVENIRNRLNLPVRKSLVPALESFGSKNSRIAATNVVIEGIGDWLRKIWEGIKRVARRLLDKIKLFFAGATKSNDSLEKLLVSLKERAQNIDSGAELDEKKLKNESLAKQLSVKKKADKSTAAILIGNATKLLTASDTSTDHIDKSAAAIKSLLGNLQESSLLSVISGLRTELSAAIGTLSEFKSADEVKTPKGKKKQAWYGPFAGSKVLVWEEEEITEAGSAVVETRISVGFEYKEEIAAEEIEALNRSEILSIIDTAMKLLNEKKDFDKGQKDAEAVLATSEKLADEVLKTAIAMPEGSGASANARVLKSLALNISSFNSLSTSLSVGSSTIVLQTVKAIADYASASIKNYDVKSK